MKPRSILITLALFALLALSPPAQAQQPLRIAFPEYRPFFYLDENDTMQGFFYEIITEALQSRMEIPLSWHSYPWTRCQKLVCENRCDAIITVPTNERLAYTQTHALPFYTKPLVLFTHAGHPRLEAIKGIRSILDIKKMGLSVVTYSGNGWNKQLVESAGIKVHETPSLPNVWQMLANRRADLAIEWPTSAWPDIKAMKVEKKIVQTDAAISGMPFHLLVSKHSVHTHVIDRFDAVIDAMRKDGTTRAILDRYGIDQ